MNKSGFRLCALLAFVVTLVGLAASALVMGQMDAAIIFESAESQTLEGKPVFNEVSFFQKEHKQIWVMRQSHEGPHHDKNKWDRLAIVVDTSSPIKQAEFFQFEPGQNVFDPNAKQVPFRASCFLCHANGPRAIRPQLASDAAPLSIIDRMRISMWNVKMARQGRLTTHPKHNEAVAKNRTPFRFSEPDNNHVLMVRACAGCHHNGPTGRGELVRQQAGTIDYLTKNNHMPPAGFPMTQNDRTSLRRFLKGF